MAEHIYDFTVRSLMGMDEALRDYAGKVLLIVNIASRCGYTQQLTGLQSLYATYYERGLMVMGFPCNQFQNQEPGTSREIQNFCQLNYGVTFPLFAKIEVNGPDAIPLYRYLVAVTGGEPIAWNFTKFLVDRQGNVVKRYEPKVEPIEIAPGIEALL